MDKQIEEIKEVLANKTKEYVEIIKSEYKDYIPKERMDFLNSIENYKDIIKIEETGTISLFVKNDKIYFPLSAFKILNLMKFIPGYGINKKHITFENKEIVNDNTFNTFMKHLYIAGVKPEGYYLEILLHECMHFCGCNGSFALTEGLTELKTRELAKKYNLLTSGCGYPKEVKLVSKLQDMFGEELCNQIAFSTSYIDTLEEIKKEKGIKGKSFYEELFILTEHQFEPYISKSYPGILGPLKKTKSYENINYDKAYELIRKYEQSLKKEKSNITIESFNDKETIKNTIKKEKKVFKVKSIHQNEEIKEMLGYTDESINKSR